MTQFVDFGERAETPPSSIQTVFDGINLDEYLTEDGVEFRTLTVSGRDLAQSHINMLNPETIHGGIFQSRFLEPRILRVKYKLKARNNEMLRNAYNDLNRLLQDNEREISFTDEPVYYIGTFAGSEEFDETSNTVISSFQFICADPYKYGREVSYQLNGPTIINNNGTMPTYPVFEGTATGTISHLDVYASRGGDRDGMSIGINADVETPTFNPNELVMHDNMSALSGWVPASSVDNGHIRGEMLTDGSSFYPDTVGHVVEGDRWQGPALKRTLPGNTTLQNFRVDIAVELQNTGNKTGMIEVYLLDTSNNVIGKIGIEDRWPEKDETYAKARVGNASQGEWFATEYSGYRPGWLDFDGIMRIEREGNTWRAYYAVVGADGKHTYMRGSDGSVRYVDVDEQYMNRLAQVQVAMRVYPLTSRAGMRVKDIKVYRRNSYAEQPVSSVEQVARSGDSIELNHHTNDVRINGESRLELKDFAANFFDLKPGNNLISVSPNNAVNMRIRFRERYL